MILKFSRPPSAEYKIDNLKLEAGQGRKNKAWIMWPVPVSMYGEPIKNTSPKYKGC
jgi:hypothetical protein